MRAILVLLSFAAGCSLIFAVNFVLVDIMKAHRERVKKRMEELMRLRKQEQARDAVAFQELYDEAAMGVADVVIKPTLRDRLKNLVNQSGLLLNPSTIIVSCLLLAVVGFAPLGLMFQRWILGVFAGLILAPLPLAYVAFCRKRRLEKLRNQLPEAFELMSRTMRAGQTVPQSLQAVAEEFEPPISEEFGLCYDQQNLGLTPENALRDLARRTGLLELKIFVLAVGIHAQTGGNMSELLDKLSGVIRQRAKIRGSIRALTAEGRMQAIVLLALPPGLLIMMLFLNRSYAMVLFDHWWLLVVTAISMAFGWLWMRKIVNFDF